MHRRSPIIAGKEEDCYGSMITVFGERTGSKGETSTKVPTRIEASFRGEKACSCPRYGWISRSLLQPP